MNIQGIYIDNKYLNQDTINLEAIYKNGFTTFKIYSYKCSEGTYAIMAETSRTFEVFNPFGPSMEEPLTDEVDIDLGLWNAGKNNIDAINLFLKKVKELETFMDVKFNVTFN